MMMKSKKNIYESGLVKGNNFGGIKWEEWNYLKLKLVKRLNVDFKAEILASLMGDVVVTYGERVQLSYCPDSMHHISVNRFKL